jgi:hypothetical protein
MLAIAVGTIIADRPPRARVQYLLQGRVQFAHAERSTVHRAKNLNVADRVETKPFWNSLLHQLDQRRGDLFRVIPFDEVEIGIRVGSAHVGHLPSADAVRVGDDVAVRSLPEHFGEPHDWHDPALDQVLKQRARSHGRKLVYVADQIFLRADADMVGWVCTSGLKADLPEVSTQASSIANRHHTFQTWQHRSARIPLCLSA